MGFCLRRLMLMLMLMLMLILILILILAPTLLPLVVLLAYKVQGERAAVRRRVGCDGASGSGRSQISMKIVGAAGMDVCMYASGYLGRVATRGPFFMVSVLASPANSKLRLYLHCNSNSNNSNSNKNLWSSSSSSSSTSASPSQLKSGQVRRHG